MGIYHKEDDEEDKTKTKSTSSRDAVDRALAKADELRKLDEHNPLEQAMKFEEIRKNPPKPGFMKVEAYEAEDDNGNACIVSKSETPDGIKWIKHHPFFITDLHTAISANIAACPSNVGPMLLDQGMKLADLEKGTFKPKKRKDENKMMVILMIAMITISVGAGVFFILQFFG